MIFTPQPYEVRNKDTKEIVEFVPMGINEGKLYIKLHDEIIVVFSDKVSDDGLYTIKAL